MCPTMTIQDLQHVTYCLLLRKPFSKAFSKSMAKHHTLNKTNFILHKAFQSNGGCQSSLCLQLQQSFVALTPNSTSLAIAGGVSDRYWYLLITVLTHLIEGKMQCKQEHFEATNAAAAVYLMASMLVTMKEEPHIKYIKGSEEYILITHCNFVSPVSRQNTQIFPHKGKPPYTAIEN